MANLLPELQAQTAAPVEERQPVNLLAELQPTQEAEALPSEEEKGFLERFGEDLDERQRQAKEILEAPQTGFERAIQLIGKPGAGTALDLIGEGLVSFFRTGKEGVESVLETGGDILDIKDSILEELGVPQDEPSPISDAAKGLASFQIDAVKGFARDQVTSLLNTDTVQEGLKRLGEGVESFREFEKENPRASRNIDALANIALIAAPGPKGAKPTPGALGRAGELFSAAADKQVLAKETKVLQALVSPKQTPKVKTEQAQRTTVTPGGTKVVQPSAAEEKMIEAVRDIPGIKESSTLQGKFNVIKDANKKEAIALEGSLAKEKIIFTKKQLRAELDKAAVTLKENPLLTGDVGKTAEKVLAKANKLISDNKGNLPGLLKARKELDAWIKKQRGSVVFQTEKDTALTLAVTEIRTVMNDFLASKAVSTNVKDSLSRQSSLFRAMDNIAVKAGEESATKLGRIIQGISKVVPVSGKITGAIGLTSLAGIVVAPTAVTTLAGLGAVGFGGHKILTSPATKRALSQLLKVSDKAITTATSPELLITLKADRAALLEIIEGISNE